MLLLFVVTADGRFTFLITGSLGHWLTGSLGPTATTRAAVACAD